MRDDTKPEDDEDSVRRIPLLRAFTLFHASQIDGIPDYVPPTIEEAPWRAPEAAEIIIANSGAVVRFGGDRAFYSPDDGSHSDAAARGLRDSGGILRRPYCMKLVHWPVVTARGSTAICVNRFGSHDYAREELRAEIGQMMVCAELGIAVSDCDFSNNAAYVASWLEKLRSDRKEIFRAAADAQRIADYLLAFHPEWAARNRAGTDMGEGEDSASRLAADTGPARAEAA